MNAKLGFLALGWPSLGRFNPFVSLAFPDSWRLLVSSLSGENVGPEVGWVGGHLVQFHLKQTAHSLVSSEGSLRVVTQGAKKGCSSTDKGSQKTQNGPSVAFKKIRLKTCFWPEEAHPFSTGLAGQKVSQRENYKLWNQDDTGPITILSQTVQIPGLDFLI